MAGLLGDVLPWVYSRGNALKRQLNGLLSDPIGVAQQAGGLLADEDRKQQSLNALAFGNPQRPFQVTDRNALAQLVDRTMAGPMGFAPAGITAWHGSPHVFDKFDSSKIGTGEGAQAYGHGLYLAESPAVAQQYSKINPPIFSADGKSSVRMIGKPTHEPQLYKVDLPDPAIARMLDWDKPIPGTVKRGLARKAVESGQVPDRRSALEALAEYDMPRDMFGAAVGKEQAQLAADLRALGIPGIRYLDGGSRGAGQGSSNFVVFPGEENMLRILERNGQPVR